MKKLFIGLILGFILHKGLEEVHDYYWYKGFQSDTCSNQYVLDIKNPKIEAPLTKRFECTITEMGYAKYIIYVLIRPHWNDFPRNNNWYY